MSQCTVPVKELEEEEVDEDDEDDKEPTVSAGSGPMTMSSFVNVCPARAPSPKSRRR
jgi:hypothetical protein